MSTTAALAPARTAPPARRGAVLSHTAQLAWRNVVSQVRQPQVLVFTFVQPVMFVLMFRYVFGGAIQVPGQSYVDFLMPGIFVQTMVFGGITTAVGLAQDMESGFVDRLRSLPMARSAVLSGRVLADFARLLVTVTIMAVVGFLVGWRPDGSALAMLAGLGLLLLFGVALLWLYVIVGLTASNAEAAQAMSFPLVFPLVFASAVFVPTESMPSWLRAFAEHQPVTAVTNALRALTTGGELGSWGWQALAWALALLLVLAPLAVARYRRRTS